MFAHWNDTAQVHGGIEGGFEFILMDEYGRCIAAIAGTIEEEEDKGVVLYTLPRVIISRGSAVPSRDFLSSQCCYPGIVEGWVS